MDMTLVVMAAGLGSRYGGIKQIERLGPDGEILMEYAIYDALRAGFDRIVLIIKPSMLEDVRALFGAPGADAAQKAARHGACRAVRARCDPHALCRHQRR